MANQELLAGRRVAAAGTLKQPFGLIVGRSDDRRYLLTLTLEDGGRYHTRSRFFRLFKRFREKATDGDDLSRPPAGPVADLSPTARDCAQAPSRGPSDRPFALRAPPQKSSDGAASRIRPKNPPRKRLPRRE